MPSHRLEAMAERAKTSVTPIRPLCDGDVISDPEQAIRLARSNVESCMNGLKLASYLAHNFKERDMYEELSKLCGDMLNDINGQEIRV